MIYCHSSCLLRTFFHWYCSNKILNKYGLTFNVTNWGLMLFMGSGTIKCPSTQLFGINYFALAEIMPWRNALWMLPFLLSSNSLKLDVSHCRKRKTRQEKLRRMLGKSIKRFKIAYINWSWWGHTAGISWTTMLRSQTFSLWVGYARRRGSQSVCQCGERIFELSEPWWATAGFQQLCSRAMMIAAASWFLCALTDTCPHCSGREW